jgi:hypothetical protein
MGNGEGRREMGELQPFVVYGYAPFRSFPRSIHTLKGSYGHKHMAPFAHP